MYFLGELVVFINEILNGVIMVVWVISYVMLVIIEVRVVWVLLV